MTCSTSHFKLGVSWIFVCFGIEFFSSDPCWVAELLEICFPSFLFCSIMVCWCTQKNIQHTHKYAGRIIKHFYLFIVVVRYKNEIGWGKFRSIQCRPEITLVALHQIPLTTFAYLEESRRGSVRYKRNSLRFSTHSPRLTLTHWLTLTRFSLSWRLQKWVILDNCKEDCSWSWIMEKQDYLFPTFKYKKFIIHKWV